MRSGSLPRKFQTTWERCRRYDDRSRSVVEELAANHGSRSEPLKEERAPRFPSNFEDRTQACRFGPGRPRVRQHKPQLPPGTLVVWTNEADRRGSRFLTTPCCLGGRTCCHDRYGDAFGHLAYFYACHFPALLHAEN